MSVFYKKCKVEQVGSRPRSCNNIFLFISSPGNLIACYPHIAIFVEAPHLLRKICTQCIIKHSSYVRTIVISWLHIFPKEQKMRQPLAHNFPDFTFYLRTSLTTQEFTAVQCDFYDILLQGSSATFSFSFQQQMESSPAS